MPANITLFVTEGPLKGQAFTFDERTTCILGRAKECYPQLPNDEHHKTISRHHCLLDINPPDIRVRDFGSLNGTFVNKTKIGQRRKDQRPEEVDHATFPEVDLRDGDELGLDHTVFRVQIKVPLCCVSCGTELSADEAQAAPGVVWCAACRAEREQARAPASPTSQRCASCDEPLAQAESAQRTGAALCPTCRADVHRLLQHLLTRAQQGEAPLRAIAGYTLMKELGRGGMGTVYLARHEATGEQVALKVMLPKVAVTDRATADFLREAETTRALHHPQVVQLREVGYAEGIYFFTLEYCSGGSLRDLLKQQGGALPIREACGYILQALDGLHAAHTAQVQVRQTDGTLRMVTGLVHRDIKPANLLLSSSMGMRVVKVSDFGLAKAFELAGLSGLSRTGEVRGTVSFMPRQLLINFKYAKPAVDVWAMAGSLYQLLTGTVPREFSPGGDPFLAVLQHDAVPIRQRNPKIPQRLAEVIDHALQDRPEIGFQTALEFKQALETALKGVP